MTPTNSFSAEDLMMQLHSSLKKQQITIEKLKQRQAQITARIQALSAKERTQERKNETRRKILVGAYFLDAERNSNLDKLNQLMDEYLTRDSDRALFGLLPLNETHPS